MLLTSLTLLCCPNANHRHRPPHIPHTVYMYGMSVVDERVNLYMYRVIVYIVIVSSSHGWHSEVSAHVPRPREVRHLASID